jgi:hypothetical protein
LYSECLIFSMRAAVPAHLIFLHLVVIHIWWRVQIMKLLVFNACNLLINLTSRTNSEQRIFKS